MKAARLLIVDDEPQIVRALRPGLGAAGYEVEAVGAAKDALGAIAARAFDVIIVDLGLPDMDGKDLIARAREWTDTPILVLSARDEEREKISALDIGANDFVNKPFSIGELMARLRALLRTRSARSRAESGITIEHLEIDFDARRTRVLGKDVRLSPREWSLLRAFVERHEEVLSHKQIVAAVWGAEANVEAQFVRVLVGNLRQKIEKDPARPALIVTEPAVGYRLTGNTGPSAGAS